MWPFCRHDFPLFWSVNLSCPLWNTYCPFMGKTRPAPTTFMYYAGYPPFKSVLNFIHQLVRASCSSISRPHNVGPQYNLSGWIFLSLRLFTSKTLLGSVGLHDFDLWRPKCDQCTQNWALLPFYATRESMSLHTHTIGRRSTQFPQPRSVFGWIQVYVRTLESWHFTAVTLPIKSIFVQRVNLLLFVQHVFLLWCPTLQYSTSPFHLVEMKLSQGSSLIVL